MKVIKNFCYDYYRMTGIEAKHFNLKMLFNLIFRH